MDGWAHACHYPHEGLLVADEPSCVQSCELTAMNLNANPGECTELSVMSSASDASEPLFVGHRRCPAGNSC